MGRRCASLESSVWHGNRVEEREVWRNTKVFYQRVVELDLLFRNAPPSGAMVVWECVIVRLECYPAIHAVVYYLHSADMCYPLQSAGMDYGSPRRTYSSYPDSGNVLVYITERYFVPVCCTCPVHPSTQSASHILPFGGTTDLYQPIQSLSLEALPEHKREPKTPNV